MNSIRGSGARCDTGLLQSIKLQLEEPGMQLGRCTSEEVQKALHSMEKKLREATIEIRTLEDSKRRSDAALVAVQQELKETRSQLAFMEQQYKLLQDLDNRVGHWVIALKLPAPSFYKLV